MRIPTLLAGAAALATLAAHAQEEPTINRVEVTGSSIKRIAAQAALPITAIKAEEFAKQGLTTAQEVLNTIPMNQTSTSGSQSVGAGTGGRSVADLRGLGGNKTLVLLNGRRLANHPYGADTVDLNIIPLTALDRVEVLRDGASAIYGTDAIGGVINFITKRSVTGFAVSAEAYAPQASGGGDEQRINVSGGIGNLAQDGWNLFGVADVHRQKTLLATERGFARTGVIPERGVSQTSGTTFPANFFSDLGISGNPSFASGCRPPLSVPSATSPTCRFDYTQMIDLIPKTQQENLLGRFSRKVGEDHTMVLELMHGRSTNRNGVAPPPLAPPTVFLTMAATSPFYPGRGITPAVPGLSGENLTVSWRPLVTGRREQFDTSLTDRAVASLEGTIAGWDYSAGLSHSLARARSAFTNGYVIDDRIVEGVGNGLLNPFGEQTAAGTAFLQNSLLLGEFLNARYRSSAFDAKASRELMQLGGGGLGVAAGIELRHDKAAYLVNRALASQASSSGYEDAQDQFGSRNIYAVFGEVNAPFRKGLELNFAARYDHYSDVGGSINPKVALRWQPNDMVLVRSSFNRGFRAPTLFDLHGPQTTTNTANPWDDPLLCPGGVAVAGANPNVVCEQQQQIRQGGNPDLNPERSRTWSAGIVVEPVKTLTLSADYWDIKLKDQINALAEQTIFGNFEKYRSLFHYNANGRQLDFIEANTMNLGEVRTRGIDLSALWRPARTPYGNVTLAADGTYVDRYDYQNERGGEFTHNAGRFADASPVFRWRHNLTLTWTRGPWTAALGNRYLSGYDDANLVDPEFEQRVEPYSTWSLSGSWSGWKKVVLTLGVKNLLDEDPPYTNQATTFQQGYDPRYTDPLGRTLFARATYSFK